MPDVTKLRARVNLYPEFGYADEGPSQKTPYADRTSGLQGLVWDKKSNLEWVEDLALKQYNFPSANLLAFYDGSVATTNGKLMDSSGNLAFVNLVGAIAAGDKVKALVVKNEGAVNVTVSMLGGTDTLVFAVITPGSTFTYVNDSADGPTLATVAIRSASSTANVKAVLLAHDIA